MRVSTLLLAFVTIGAAVLGQAPSVGPQVEPARNVVTYAPKPDYSFEARSHWMEGRGIFTLTVLPDGTVASVEITKSTGHRELDESTVAAFQRWRFNPGKAAPHVKIPIEYSLAGLHPPGIESALEAEKSGSPPPKSNASWQEYWQKCMPMWTGSHSDYADYFRKRRKALGLSDINSPQHKT